MLLSGTANLPGYGWGTPGNTVSQSLKACQALPLVGKPGSTADLTYEGYLSCDEIVLGFMLRNIVNAPWDRSGVFEFAGLRSIGQLTDAMVYPQRAVDYLPSGAVDPSRTYNDFFAAYSTLTVAEQLEPPPEHRVVGRLALVFGDRPFLDRAVNSQDDIQLYVRTSNEGRAVRGVQLRCHSGRYRPREHG
jgi:hypothetical protein